MELSVTSLGEGRFDLHLKEVTRKARDLLEKNVVHVRFTPTVGRPFTILKSVDADEPEPHLERIYTECAVTILLSIVDHPEITATAVVIPATTLAS